MRRGITIFIETDEGDEQEITLPFRWEICGCCEGRGKSSAYLGAITEGDRQPGGTWEDPDEFADYMAGAYDRRCDECGGSGKVQVVDEQRCNREHLKAWREHCRDMAEMDAIERAERRMGA